MKLRSGDMLAMEYRNGVLQNGVLQNVGLKLQLIGRNEVPRVEREGRG